MHTRRLAWSGLLVAVVLVTGCSSPEVGADAPPWLQRQIEQISSEEVSNPPTEIWKYSYQDAIVYYRPARCCDIPSTLWSADGEVLCHPDGGLTGAGDGQCPDFAEARSDKDLVWRDPRGGSAG
ncbi:MAG TPA: hypothetical protein VGA69_02295 [Nitriliruptorales bacterium]